MQLLSSLLLSATIWSASNALPSINYKYRSYEQIVDTLKSLATKYPDYTELYTAQSRYNISLRDELQCQYGGKSQPCEHYVLEIVDKATREKVSDRPQVFISGALHGDERVGPQTTVALAELLLDHVSRPDGNAWLQHLVKTRVLVLMPMTNPHGYNNIRREENGRDPNRDFNYGKGAQCMETITGRAVNEVWLDHLFQLSITFHAGIRQISYEWGSNNHMTSDGKSDISPDDRVQWYLGRGMSRYGGRFQEDQQYYPDGRMNDILYAVMGGMEDWAYAASWENEFSTPKPIGVCNPKTYGGYPAAKTLYNSATHRALNVLVETSRSKFPSEASLGNNMALSDEALMSYLPDSQTIGHVARNVRLSLFFLDLAEPYVQFKTAPKAAQVNVPVTFEWEVGGCITVDSTQLEYKPSNSLKKPEVTAPQSGVSRWYHSDLNLGEAPQNAGVFTETITFTKPGRYYVEVAAMVDQDWAKQPERPTPNVPPQTHIVNARTNENWSYSNRNSRVVGRPTRRSGVIEVVVV